MSLIPKLLLALLLLAVPGLFTTAHTSTPTSLMPPRTSKTIVFITGAFVSNRCWDEWKAYFEHQGYTCYAPAWPNKEAPAAVLRSQHPNSPIATNRLAEVARFHADFIRRLPEKPILIGHSYGGLLTQLLVQKDLAVAGVAIHSVPPKGVLSFKWSFLRSVTPPLGLFTSAKTSFLMSFKQWQYAFTNGMSLAEQKASYEQFVTPESKKMSRDALSGAAKVDFSKPHVPLLFVAGSTDHIMPASLNYSTYQRYKKHSGSITDYKEFEGRNHFVLGLPTWREEADFIATWLEQQRTAKPVPGQATQTQR